MSGPKGRITTSYTVWCADCPQHRELDAPNMSLAADEARAAGWTQRKRPIRPGSAWNGSEWTCPAHGQS